MQADAADSRPREAGGHSPPSRAGPCGSGTAARVAWSLWALTVGLLAGGVVLEALNHAGQAMLWQQSLALVPMSVSFATVGALIGSRRPGNLIGWLCLALGVVVAELLCAWQYATYALVTAPGSLPGGQWAAWAAIWPIELSALLPILVFLLFPHGRLLSPRWRPLLWLAVAATTVQLGASALSEVNTAPTSGSPTTRFGCWTLLLPRRPTASPNSSPWPFQPLRPQPPASWAAAPPHSLPGEEANPHRPATTASVA